MNKKYTDIGITEKQFERQVKELADLFGWLYHHTWLIIHSPAGFPDCVLVRDNRVIFAELKSEKGKLSPAQEVWLEKLRATGQAEVYLWRPADFDDIVVVLRREDAKSY